jgi:hypothetical protein
MAILASDGCDLGGNDLWCLAFLMSTGSLWRSRGTLAAPAYFRENSAQQQKRQGERETYKAFS